MCNIILDLYGLFTGVFIVIAFRSCVLNPVKITFLASDNLLYFKFLESAQDSIEP